MKYHSPRLTDTGPDAMMKSDRESRVTKMQSVTVERDQDRKCIAGWLGRHGLARRIRPGRVHDSAARRRGLSPAPNQPDAEISVGVRGRCASSLRSAPSGSCAAANPGPCLNRGRIVEGRARGHWQGIIKTRNNENIS